MPAVRSVLKHVTVEVSKGRRKCGRKKNEHVIAKGETFLRVREEGQGYSNYCVACAPDILEIAGVEVPVASHTLEARLYESTGGACISPFW